MMAESNELEKYVPLKILPGPDNPDPKNPDYNYILIENWNELDDLYKYKKFYTFYFIDHTDPKYKLQGPFDLTKSYEGLGYRTEKYKYKLGVLIVTNNNEIKANLSIYRGPKKKDVITTFDELEAKKDCYMFFVIDDPSSSQTQQGPYDLTKKTSSVTANLNGYVSTKTTYNLGKLEVANKDNNELNEFVTIFLGPEKSGPGCNIMGGTRRNKSRRSRKSKKSKKSKKSRKSRKSRRSRK